VPLKAGTGWRLVVVMRRKRKRRRIDAVVTPSPSDPK